MVDYQEHFVETNELVDNTINNIEHILVALTELDIDSDDMESGINHLDIASNDTATTLVGLSAEEDATAG